MTAVLAGLGAAVAFSVSALCAARAAQLIGPWSTAAWSMLIGLGVVAPLVLVTGLPEDVDAGSWALLGAIAVANPLGLGLQYLAYGSGKVAIVSAVVSTEGAIAGLIAVAGGERLAAVQGLGLCLITAGVCAAAMAPDPSPVTGQRPLRALALALAVAVLFAVALYSAGKAGSSTSIALALVPARLGGALLIAAPLALTSRLRLTRGAVPLVMGAGLAELAGVTSIVVGSGSSLAVTAVLSAQWAALTAVGAYFWLGQRLGATQFAGMAAIIGGVAVVTSSVA